MMFEIIKEKTGYAAMFLDNGGVSIIYRGSKKQCSEYIRRQKKKLRKGLLVHVSKTVHDMQKKKLRQEAMHEWETIGEQAELKALSKYSLEHPLSDKQYERMMQLKKKVIGQ